MWSTATDPLSFDEALAWFRARVPLTEDEWAALSNRARRRAFTVAGVAELDLVSETKRSLERAIARGTTFEDWKRAIGDMLRAAWGGSVRRPAARLETIFRTTTQTAYSAGRHRQLTDPAVRRARPFWLYDAILDDRTTPTCKPRPEGAHGTLLPADHPWWKTHTPPLHFRCRSGIRSLRRAQVEARGGVTPAPAIAAQTGFGLEPGAGEWQPDATKYDPELWAIHEAKAP